MKLLYLASPYSHPDRYTRVRRFTLAARAAGVLTLRREYLVFAPIVHSHPIVEVLPDIGGDWKTWQEVDREWIARADTVGVLQLAGWQESVGVQAEIKLATALGKPILWLTLDGLGL